jgi:hypothetical protein
MLLTIKTFSCNILKLEQTESFRHYKGGGKMKKTFKMMLAGTVATLLLSVGSVWATSYTYTDNYANWPGWFVNAADHMGTPEVTGLTVETGWTTSGGQSSVEYLKSVTIAMTGRREWDSLFINSNWTGEYGDYQSWDYYVRDTTLGNGALYSVISTFDPATDYVLATNVGTSYSDTSGRWGHPESIDPLFLTDMSTAGFLLSVIGDTTSLTYTFTGEGITMGEHFVIGYAPWCANDVFLTPVPEPGILLLLGFGLVGIGILKKRIG